MSFQKGMLVGAMLVGATVVIMGAAQRPPKVLDVERINEIGRASCRERV